MATGFHPDCTCERETRAYLVTPPSGEQRTELLCPFCAAQVTEYGYAVEGPLPAAVGAC